MKVPLLDLKAQYQTFKSEVLQRMDAICESQYFILGPQVEQMEKNLADYCRTPYAVGTSSGTDALLAALMAAGVVHGDTVITTPYTFFATVGTIVRLGAKPLFVDIDPRTYNLDPGKLAQLIESLSRVEIEKIKAIVPVHLYGQCADMDPILALCRQHRITVIEDAAQAIGSEYKGKRAGSLGDFGCFSFFPSKNLGAFGDAGLVTTRDAENDRMLRMMRMHGMHPKYYHHYVGGNFRLDALQAAVIDVKLKYLDGWTEGRQANADTYRRLFAQAGLEDVVGLPAAVQDRHIYNQFIIRVEREKRDGLRQYLTEREIGTEVYYPIPLHLQACFKTLAYKAGDFPESEKAALETIALPIYPELQEAQLDYVVDSIKAFFQRH